MKKILAFALLLALFVTPAIAESIDLSGLSFDELVALRDRINLALWESSEWQEVTVPMGTWEIGKDIPAGHWTLKAADGKFAWVIYGDVIDESGDIDFFSHIYIDKTICSPSAPSFDPLDNNVQIDIDMKDGCYVCIRNASVVFVPFTGKPDLGFK